MKRYSKPEEYIRRLEESNEDLRKELKKYKYISDVNYELEEENRRLKSNLKRLGGIFCEVYGKMIPPEKLKKIVFKGEVIDLE